MDAFRVRDGIDAGIGRGRLQGPSFARPFWGIRTPSPPETVHDLADAFAPRLPARAFFVGRTAAALHGIPLPAGSGAAGPLHVGVPAGARRVDARSIVAHHLLVDDRDITLLAGLRVTTPERTWCDLAADGSFTVATLVAAGDRILWRHDPLGRVDELGNVVHRYAGRRGTRLIASALPLLCDRADSAPESELRVAIHAAGLPAPDVNSSVHDRHGRFVATPDLSWPRVRIALEYEGDHHRVDAVQWHRDVERFGRLQEAGWVVLRATAADYRRPDPLLRRLAAIILSRSDPR